MRLTKSEKGKLYKLAISLTIVVTLMIVASLLLDYYSSHKIYSREALESIESQLSIPKDASPRLFSLESLPSDSLMGYSKGKDLVTLYHSFPVNHKKLCGYLFVYIQNGEECYVKLINTNESD